MPITRAKELLKAKEASFLPMNRPSYELVSERMIDLLRINADHYERTGIDEAYLDVTIGSDHDFEQAKDIAVEIKKQVYRQENMTCSVGIAPKQTHR